MTSAVIPDPVPAEGYRKLSLREMAQRQRALTCIRSRETAQCQGQVYVTLFFDGTNNNKNIDEPQGKHSNVTRLYKASNDDPKNGFFLVIFPA